MEEKWGYIDKAGKVVIQLKCENVSDFSEGLALVQIEDYNGMCQHRSHVIRRDL